MVFINCCKRVTCPIDGKTRTFYFQAIRNADGTYRPGCRHGCNERSGDHRCIQCWRDVRWQVFSRKSKT